MLVLTRKLKGEIQIGDNITIRLLRIRGNSVPIGIDARENVRIVRRELLQNTSVDIDDVQLPLDGAAGEIFRNSSNQVPPSRRQPHKDAYPSESCQTRKMSCYIDPRFCGEQLGEKVDSRMDQLLAVHRQRRHRPMLPVRNWRGLDTRQTDRETTANRDVAAL